MSAHGEHPSLMTAARSAIHRIAHDRLSVVVLAFLAVADFPIVRAAIGQWQAERSLRQTTFSSMPSAVPSLVGLALLLPVGFIALWVCATAVVEWWRNRTVG
jgi:hypothetical protein